MHMHANKPGLNLELPKRNNTPPPPPPPPPPVASKAAGSGKFVTMAVATLALVGLAVLGWYAYDEATAPKSVEDLPVISADMEPYKVTPRDPGGMKIPNLDKSVFNTVKGKSASDVDQQKEVVITPSMEEPVDRSALQEKAQEQINAVKQEVFQLVQENGAKSVERVDEDVLAGEDFSGSEEGEAVESADASEILSSGESELPATLKSAAEQQEPAAAPKTVAVEEKAPAVKAKPAPAAKPAEKAAAKPVPAAPKPVVAKTIAPPASMPEAKAKTVVSGGGSASAAGIKVQLGAYRSQAEANSAWSAAKAKFSAELGGMTSHIQKADLGAKGVFYRLQVGNFSSQDAASAACAKLKAKSQGCFLVK